MHELHGPDFTHDNTCEICAAHRRAVDEVRRAMLEDLRKAMEQAGIARPWSPAEEWRRLLEVIGERYLNVSVP